MTGAELVVMLVISWGVARLATRDARAMARRGKGTARTDKWKAAKKAKKNSGVGSGRYGLSDYAADLWHDSMEDARTRREARRAARPEGWELQPGRARKTASRWGQQLDVAWKAADARIRARHGKRGAEPDAVADQAEDRASDREPTPEQPRGPEHCQACGRVGAEDDPLVDDYDEQMDRTSRVHQSHLDDLKSGFYKGPRPPWCKRCGGEPTDGDPLVAIEGGHRVHKSHLDDPEDGLHNWPREPDLPLILQGRPCVLTPRCEGFMEQLKHPPNPVPGDTVSTWWHCATCDGSSDGQADLDAEDRLAEWEHPLEDVSEPCDLSGCKGRLELVPQSEHADEDGRVWIRVKCPLCQAGRDKPVTNQPSSWKLFPTGSDQAAAGGTGSGKSQDPQTAQSEYEVYDNQPYTDLTGVPADATRPCTTPECGGTMRPLAGTQDFDADGGAGVDIECAWCNRQSVAYWNWTDLPPAENVRYLEDQEHREAARERWAAQNADRMRTVVDDPPRVELIEPEHIRTGPDAGQVPYVYAERDGQALAVVYPIRPSVGHNQWEEHNMTNATEVTGLASAKAYAHQLSHMYGADQQTGLEMFKADLESHEVSGEALTALDEGAEHLAAAAACFGRVESELNSQDTVAEAYAATPGAGSKQFVTGE